MLDFAWKLHACGDPASWSFRVTIAGLIYRYFQTYNCGRSPIYIVITNLLSMAWAHRTVLRDVIILCDTENQHIYKIAKRGMHCRINGCLRRGLIIGQNNGWPNVDGSRVGTYDPSPSRLATFVHAFFWFCSPIRRWVMVQLPFRNLSSRHSCVKYRQKVLTRT